MADFSKLIGTDGVQYDVKDATARALIESLSRATLFLGVTSTELTDKDTTNPITIDGESVTAQNGNIAIFGDKEFIFNGTMWFEFGDTTALGALAYMDNASTSYTPDGTVAVTPVTTTVTGIADVGTLPVVSPTTAIFKSVTEVGTLPTLTYNNATETLTFNAGTLPTTANQTVVTDVGYIAGTLPTKSAAQTVMTGATATFTGTTDVITVPAPDADEP
jgi:hypothetical protein